MVDYSLPRTNKHADTDGTDGIVELSQVFY